MSFQKPSYAEKFKALATDPKAQVIRGCIIEILGYPFVGKKVDNGSRPAYYKDSTIQAGKEK